MTLRAASRVLIGAAALVWVAVALRVATVVIAEDSVASIALPLVTAVMLTGAALVASRRAATET